MSVTSTSADELVFVGGGSASTRIDYPNQFECSEQEPCDRYLRNATNSLGVVRSEGGGHAYYLVNLDAIGNEK
jgi:hypothetical protein